MGSTRPTSRAPRCARWMVGVAALVVVGLVPVPSSARPGQEADADQARRDEAREATLALAPEAPPAPDDPFHAVVLADEATTAAALVRLETTAAAAEAATAHLLTVAARDAAQAVVDDARSTRNDARTELATEKDRLSKLSAHAFVSGGTLDLDTYREILAGDTTAPAAGRQIMFTQVLDRQIEVVEQATADLKVARAELAEARVELAAAQEVADTAEAEADRRGQARDEAVAAHDAAVVDAADARTRLASAARRTRPPVSEATPIIGLPRLSAEDLATWFARSPYRPRIPTPIEDIAGWFIAEGHAEGIRGDIAFAQAVLETGGFANNDSVSANNYSGIGHCDSCGSGWTFPSPEMGVRAQIQLLKSYAVTKPDYANPLVDSRLRGPAGCCATWGELTTRWATDPGYGPKIVFIYTSMVDHALARRAAGEA